MALHVRDDRAGHSPGGPRHGVNTAPSPAKWEVGRQRRIETSVMVATVVTAGGYAASTVLRTSGQRLVWADWWLYSTVFLGATALCIFRAWLQPRQRAGWSLIAGSLLLYLLTYVGFGLIGGAGGGDYPWAGEVIRLAVTAAACAGIVLLVRSKRVSIRRILWLDWLIAALAVVSISSAVGFDHLGGASTSQTLLTSLLPLGYLVLLVTAVWAVGATGGHAITWPLLGAGLAMFAVVTMIYALQISDGTYVWGGPLDSLWAIAAALIGLAAYYCHEPKPLSPGEFSRWSVVFLPSVFIITSASVLIYSLAVGDIPSLSGYLALACLVALILRVGAVSWHTGGTVESSKHENADPLTGLMNRAGLTLALDGKFAAHQSVVLLMIDLDHFKAVNDSLGHAAGDELLRSVGQRLFSSLRDGDLLARLGGDEFAILLTAPGGTGVGTRVAERILYSFSDPFELLGVSLEVGASIGIAAGPDDSEDGSTLLRHADVAMYEVKGRGKGRGYEVYQPEHDRLAEGHLRTIEDLRKSIMSDQLVLHYLPKIDLPTGAVVGVEALVRWQHPERGLLAPDKFLALAEQNGLMGMLFERVLDQALSQLRQWRDQGRGLGMAVNLSASNLMDVALTRKIGAMLEQHGIKAQWLTLDVTEKAIMADPGRAGPLLTALSTSGVQIAVDNYGSGYSSLAYLQDLPIRELKLDRAIVMGFEIDDGAVSVMRSTIELAHSIGHMVVAEGVVSSESARVLTEMGCDVAQGYYYSRPLPAPQMTDWLDARQHADVDRHRTVVGATPGSDGTRS